MNRYDPVKRNFTSRPRHHRRRRSPTFMEFVHRQEERQENHEQAAHGDTLDAHPVPLVDMMDLLLAGTLLFIFITMLLLVMN